MKQKKRNVLTNFAVCHHAPQTDTGTHTNGVGQTDSDPHTDGVGQNDSDPHTARFGQTDSAPQIRSSIQTVMEQ